MSILKFKKLSSNAFPPVKGSQDSVGFDLKSAETVTVEALNKGVICSDLAIEVPEGCYGRIAARSSTALQNLIIGGGVIDPDFRGNVKIIVHNLNKEPITINKGSRVAQLIIECFMKCEIQECLDLTTTERNCKGFGSSGTE